MTRQRRIVLAKTAIVMGALPLLVWAYEYGPIPGYCGVPNENGGSGGATCATAGCHTGTANDPNNKGSVVVSFPSGLSYTPGVPQQLSVTITDATEKAAGFQLTARLASAPSTMAGTFAVVDTFTQVVCSATNLQVYTYLNKDGQNCPSKAPLQYIEHTGGSPPTAEVYSASTGGFENSIAHGLPYSYSFTWTPPATNVGNIIVYVAANAGVGEPPSQTGDHIYSTKYTLTPASSATAPVIASSGIVNGASFQPGIVPNSWLTIQGTNLASTTDTWANAIVNGKLPTSLDGVSVNVGGQPAYVYYVSPTQINVLAPNIGPGSAQVTVTASNTTSPAATATAQVVQPAFFLWPPYAVATRQDFSYAVKAGTFAGVTTTPAKPGDVLILWGTGFGPTNPAAPVGVQTPSDQTYSTATPVSVMIGSNAATVYGAALAPGFAGLYQVAIQVPASIANGDYPIVATINGVSSPASTLLTIHN